MPRQDFNDDEDQLLIKYLAKYTPTLSGRRGNRVFQTLVENGGRKWPWAAAHPWQSWRNRYVKDQEYFDSRIRRYQKKHQAQETNGANDRLTQTKQAILEQMRQNNGRQRPIHLTEEAFTEEEEDVSNSSEKQRKRPPKKTEEVSAKEEDVEDHEQELSTPYMQDDSAAQSPAPDHADDAEAEPSHVSDNDRKLPILRTKRKKNQSESAEWEDGSSIFTSLSPSSRSPLWSPLPVSRPTRQPPKLREGPFSVSLTDSKGKARSRQVNEDTSETESEKEKEPVSDGWPPRRSRVKAVEKATQSPSKNVSRPAPAKVDRDVQTSVPYEEPTPKRPKTNTAVKVVRIASKSPSTISPRRPHANGSFEHHPFSQPSQFPETQIPSSPTESHHPFSQPTQEPTTLLENGDEGLASLIKQIAKNQGFHENVTWRVWQTVEDLQKVDMVLKIMREAAEKAGVRAVEGVGIWQADSSEHTPRRDYLQAVDPTRRPSRSHARSDRQFTPVPVRSNQDLDYTPPEASRAGRFARLAQLGRVEETSRREASSASVSPQRAKWIEGLVTPKFSSPIAGETQRGVADLLTTTDAAEAGLDERGSVDRPEEVVWGKTEDAVLQRGSELELESLELNMGRYSVRQRTMQLLTSLGVL